MPALSFLEFASNRLESLVVPPKLAGPLSFPLSSSLRELRLDNNAFSSWAHLAPLRDLTSYATSHSLAPVMDLTNDRFP
jgi:Leucine-rich repeat (LRR) protein